MISDMSSFSQKTKNALKYYVYALVDTRKEHDSIFYVGKGHNDRVFQHEKDSKKDKESIKKKLKTIAEIEAENHEVKKIILVSGLEDEKAAYAAEAAVINSLNYMKQANITLNDELTNEVAGHHSKQALLVEDVERIHGAKYLREKNIKHNLMVIKINERYRFGMPEKDLYDSVRGVWKASKKRVEKEVDYVLGVYNNLIVAVYRPSRWFKYDKVNNMMPRNDIPDAGKYEDRIYFEDDDYLNTKNTDTGRMYYGKSLVGLIDESIKDKSIIKYTNKVLDGRNPIMYLPRPNKKSL